MLSLTLLVFYYNLLLLLYKISNFIMIKLGNIGHASGLERRKNVLNAITTSTLYLSGVHIILKCAHRGGVHIILKYAHRGDVHINILKCGHKGDIHMLKWGHRGDVHMLVYTQG
uniref:Uncharacterized protein n=1 Tax=Cacopsylla melanoneura TaxID=428564 RepID=A0A8D8S8D8_9HEMI